MTINKQEDILYNNILLLSRNKLFFTKFNLNDTFQNRIYLIFIHISFLFIKIKQTNQKQKYKNFYQKMFDLIFKKIELNMREIGYGDIAVNSKMKNLVKSFYNILLKCKNYKSMKCDQKREFISVYFSNNRAKIDINVPLIVDYFDKFRFFCTNLSLNLIERGIINFSYFTAVSDVPTTISSFIYFNIILLLL